MADGAPPTAAAASGQDGRAARPRGLTPGRAYVLIGGLLTLVSIGQTLNHAWSGLDFWVWLGPVREFAAHPFDPSHPLVAVDAPDSYLSPYTFLLGQLTRATGLDAVTVMSFAAIANLMVVLAGTWYLARQVSRHVWCPVFLLVFNLLAWGWRPWRWSGYLGLNSMGYVLPLGSTLAYGLALLLLGAWWRWLDERTVRPLLVVAPCLAFVVLVHQPTALWVTLIMIGLAIPRLRSISLREWRDLAIVSFAVGAVVVAWPYYSVIELTANLGGFDEINTGTVRSVVTGSVLALPGFVLLLAPLRRRQFPPTTAAFVLVGGVFLVAWVTDRGSLGRVMPGVMLLAHLAMAEWMAKWVDTPARERSHVRVVHGLLVVILLVGLAGSARMWLRAVPRSLVPEQVRDALRLDSEVDANRPFRDFFDDDDVVAAPAGVGIPIAGGAAHVVAVDIPQPFVPDAAQRESDTIEMVDPETAPVRRRELIERYGVDWLVVERAHGERVVASLFGASIVGEVNGYVVIDLG